MKRARDYLVHTMYNNAGGTTNRYDAAVDPLSTYIQDMQSAVTDTIVPNILHTDIMHDMMSGRSAI